MQAKFVNLTVLAILLICQLTDISQEKVEGCTIGVASDKATADGRPLMWKNSDSSYRPKEMVYFKDSRFKYLAVVSASDSHTVVAGINEFGFCIMNGMAFNLPRESKTGLDGNAMMKWALQQCVTADDFESLLKQTNVSGRTTREHLGVIDAFGGAAIFETGNFSYTRFDATDPKVAPQGYIVRANFAFTGSSGGDFGRARYDCANQLWRQAVEKNQLDYRYVLRKVCRDFSGAEEVSHIMTKMEATKSNTIKVLRQQNVISNHNTRWVALFHGVRPDENPSLTTFWAIMGGPIFSVAVPSWVIAESTAPEMDGEEFSPLCTIARDLYLANYVTGDKGKFHLNPDMLPDIWAVTYPAEDRIFDQTESIMARWRQDYPTAQQVASFHQHMASEAMNTLQEVSELLMRKGGPMARLCIALHMRSVEKAKAFIEGCININVSDGHGYTPLHYAVQNNQKEIVHLLISKNADMNLKTRLGLSPLHIALDGSNKDIVDLLLTKGADINAVDNSGNTLLHNAARNGQRDIVGLLIDKGSDINATNKSNQTSLDIAVQRNRKEVVELLIEKGADISIHVAVRFGALAKVRSLIEEVADIDAKDKSGQTALHHASRHGYRDIVEILLAHEADVNSKDKDDITPAHVALRENHSAVLDLLIAKGASLTLIHLSAYQGDLDKVRDFIAKGTDVNATDSYGATPLHYAAIGGSKKVVEFLITRGVHVNAKDENDATSVHFAARRGHKDIVQILITYGADVNAKDQWGYTPLYYAVGQEAVAELLIANSADVNVKDVWGLTPLHSAVKSGQEAAVRQLIAKGADVNAKDNWVRTPLWLAQEKGHTKIVELLKKHGAK